MATVLEEIVERKKADLPELKARYPRAATMTLPLSKRSLEHSLRYGSGFILECKKASPSKGLIRQDFDPKALAAIYQQYASGISVLTDEPYFQGHPDYLAAVAQSVKVPVLMKDFFIDPFQVRLARYLGADAILLMLSVLDDASYLALAEEAQKLNLDILTEVATPGERDRAVKLGARIIGINNRNLHDMTIDLARTEQLAKAIPEDRVVISESGIKTHSDVKRLKAVAKGFLVGSELMSKHDVNLACRQLVLGEHKVCGLTKAADAKAAYDAGATYGGLIFAGKSPRAVTEAEAATIKAGAPLAYVGVFVDAPAEQVAAIADRLGLFAVQLHGNEDAAYVAALRGKTQAQIWKACTVDAVPALAVDRLVVDSQHQGQFGGTGATFDWAKLPQDAAVPLMLAGGLGPDNVQSAQDVPGIIGLDLNSKLELAPGVKDPALIQKTFQLMRQA
ncbi:MAG: bifunctional indole-3-glycerol-phosphate synthase TrpC/phosphoribosylanthranilate isomerase TrpF [Pseudomonadota bacterium]|uniref:Multifunctional fusion protein n=1 Tax=Gallaecimonas pentaromativorans TaxID=584787 RepID=A0A3N1PKA0_9GAMM|nr:bifunctional indole-3-glycerol-phosphate synthase TrpC/phosphoribosylanthranilate isomerase TrpF [Gallaecimonas pentaromativorans]MED5525803.1 bifunctional indole-3-glycerol-phosphate synthase TrpC/phosphoribosylanthranilate isomerase TrpF [Pseudomonadota bacterium]ROQ24966.1 indole-3-glycerol phosphate synthase [Gallaecimonas pentaromativorans]